MTGVARVFDYLLGFPHTTNVVDGLGGGKINRAKLNKVNN